MEQSVVTLSETVEILGGEGVLSRSIHSLLDLNALIHEGVPVQALRSVIGVLGEPETKIITAIGIPRSNLHRSKVGGGRLGFVESERTIRLGRIVALGKQALGSAAATGRWLLKPNKALGGEVPLRLLQTDVGSGEVEAVLGRALLGGYS